MENVLASRYASAPMVDLWSTTGKIILERQLWIAVMEAQKELGLDISDQTLADYQAVVEQVDLASIRKTRRGHPPRRQSTDRRVLCPRRA
jgi:Adenylosuccinate lyase